MPSLPWSPRPPGDGQLSGPRSEIAGYHRSSILKTSQNNGTPKKPDYPPRMATPWLNPEWRPASSQATVIMIHGAVVDGQETFLLRRRLRQLGYRTRLFKWQSMRRGLDHSVRRLAQFIRETEGDAVHVIGHSMGGVLIRQVFEQAPDPRPGRLIAIGSPLLDCWVAHRFLRLHPRIGPLLIGRAVHDHILHPPGPVWRGARDFGVIAGTYPFGIGAIFSSLPVPSDGVVLLDETKLQGLRDHVAYRINHFGLLASKRCAAQVACFLATGAFYEDVSRHDATTATGEA